MITWRSRRRVETPSGKSNARHRTQVRRRALFPGWVRCQETTPNLRRPKRKPRTLAPETERRLNPVAAVRDRRIALAGWQGELPGMATASLQTHRYDPWLTRFAWFTAGATPLLLYFAGMVTSKGVGLSRSSISQGRPLVM